MNAKLINYIFVFVLAILSFFLYQENKEKRALGKSFRVSEKAAEQEIKSLTAKFEDQEVIAEEKDKKILKIRQDRESLLLTIQAAKIKEDENKNSIFSYDADSLARYFSNRRRNRQR